MRRLLGIVVAAISLAVAASPASAALRFGFWDQAYAVTNPAGYAADSLELNGSISRFAVDWNAVARTKPAVLLDPNDPAYNWSEVDLLVTNAAAAGQDIVLTLWRTPIWATKYNKKPHRIYTQQVPKPALLGLFARVAAIRYSGTFVPPGAAAPLPRVTRWEAWNEPNQIGGLAPQVRFGKSTAPLDYAAMLSAVYRNVHAVAAANGYKVQVAGGSLAPYKGKSGMSPITFLKRMAKAKPKFDVVAVHPYPQVPRRGLRDGVRAPDVSIHNYAEFVAAVDGLWPMKKYRFWITEFGWQSVPDPFGTTLPQQATLIKQSINILKKRFKRTEMLINFLIVDEERLAGWQSGLRTFDGTKKPGYDAWVAATS